MRVFIGVGAVMATAAGAFASDPWADHVVSYIQGNGVNPGYNLAVSAMGSPTRYTGVGVFPGAVTPFNPAYLGSEIVSIGAGGSLVLSFDEPVANDAANPFGIDLIVFGNAGYIDTNFPTGTAGAGMFGVGNGGVEVSADGTNWFSAAPIADAAFPTLGYLDLSDPYALNAGAVNSDFTRPVNPLLNVSGLNFAQIVAGYAGSGGGTGIDIGSLGLVAISYVRITNPGSATVTVDIDGVSDVSAVPAPGALSLLALAGLAASPRRRRV
jgi:hypothetical protein